MQNRIKKIKLKGNESFNFREGWLRKGMRCVSEDPMLFSKDDVMERLGVGSKMVKSIKYWLLATGLCEEKYVNKGRGRALYLTKEFGEIIQEKDPYFDDSFTLFALHYHLVKNSTLCMVWNIFFNDFSGVEFTKDDMTAVCSEYLQKKMEEGAHFSDSLFQDDCSSVLRMYYATNATEDPEESLQCPLNTLGLLNRSSYNKNVFIKTAPRKDLLDKLSVLYVLIDNLPEGKESISINDLVNNPDNVGHIFNLSRVRINEYLDQLRVAGYIKVNRAAGLDMVYLTKEYKAKDILIEYYDKYSGEGMYEIW